MNIEEFVRYIKENLVTGSREYLRFKIAAILLFGSWTRGAQASDSDVDLLVVADNIHPKRHRRGEEIASIKQILLEIPLDILLLTKEEVASNFENHNPLFLDIAEEGVIIVDEDDFLLNLISETGAYVRQRGIKRFGDGWIFPVKRGVEVYLSKISNKDFSRAMLKDGERDFEIGKKLNVEGYYDKAVYHFQQSVEKSVKPILIAMGIFQKTHLIGGVLQKVISEKDVPEKWKENLLELGRISESIEPEVSLSRYPGVMDGSLWLPFDEYKREDADGAMEKAEKSLSIAKGFIGDWFS